MSLVRYVFASEIVALAGLPVPNAQGIHYGLNDEAGHRIDRGDAKIYYEIYGKGPPVLLLHGGLYGYIDEFERYIETLRANYTVIVAATRGHGRSEIGSKPFTYELLAADASAVLSAATDQPAMVIGFGDGAITALHLATEHPSQVKKAVIVGGGLGVYGLTPQGLAFARYLTPEKFDRDNRKFVAFRRPMTPEPARWDEFVSRIRELKLGPVFIAADTVRMIHCPALLIGGDRDEYFKTAHFLEVRALIPHSFLAIVPNCGHVESLQQPMVLEQLILPFLRS